MAVSFRRTAALALALGLIAGAAAAAAPSAQTIVDNERAFERAAIERGTRAGFLEFLAESSVVLGPQPVPGRAATEDGPAPGAPLRWRPDLASISGQGDFGWASGPFLSYATSTAEPPAAAGHYLTVWRRGEDGRWRVLLDGGVSYPIDDRLVPRQLEVTPRLRRAGGGHGRASDCSAAFGTRWQDKGRAAALKEYLADDARLLLAGAAVEDGRATWLRADPLRGATLAKLRTAKTLAADGGDVAVSYGEYDIAARLDAPARRFVFVHAWDVGKDCRLALEMLNLVK
jgi:ketosteroid isomerase-like protein